MDRSIEILDGALATQGVANKVEDSTPLDMALKNAALPVEPEAGPSCPVVQVTVTLEDGSAAAEGPPHFFTTEIAPGAVLTIHTCPETDVTELYLPPEFRCVGEKIVMPDYLIPCQTFWMICKVGKIEMGDGCAFPIFIYGVWKGKQ